MDILWNCTMLVFEERGKLKKSAKKNPQIKLRIRTNDKLDPHTAPTLR